jgi:prevent-host-death family protein
MKTIEMKEATAPLSEYAEVAAAETVVVTRQGQPVAAVVSLADVDFETLSLSTNPDFMAIIERSRARCPPGSGVSSDEMRRRLAARRAGV